MTLFLIPCLAKAETTKTIYNPFTGKLDFITTLSSSTLPGGSTQYIQNSSSEQQGQFNVSSGTIRNRFNFDTVGTTYLNYDGSQVCLYVLNTLKECWSAYVEVNRILLENSGAIPVGFLLAEDSSFILSETGDKIIQESI